MAKTLYQKVWEAHTVGQLEDGRTQLFIGTHLIHEVTSPQAFGMLRDLDLKVQYPQRTFATIDHIVPTENQDQPADPLAAEMIKAIRENCDDFGVTYFDLKSGKQGIVHVVGPEQGITQPGTTIACGDSHTATHGAFGAIAFGIGTTQVRDVLATQTLAMESLKVRRIEVNGELDALRALLLAGNELVASGGRMSIISYHSLEDRMVKNFFRYGNLEGEDKRDIFGRSLSPWKVITRKAIKPTDEEIEINPRARSARLRVAEKI